MIFRRSITVGLGASLIISSIFVPSWLLPIHAQTKTTFAPGKPTSFYFDVKGFGAKGDGKALDSPAINKAIDAASATGGGTVFFPAGTYRSFSIRLKSNITLYFDQGSTLLAADPN